jgi:hypothetical protein
MGCTATKPIPPPTTTTTTGGGNNTATNNNKTTSKSPKGNHNDNTIPDEGALFSRGETDSVYEEIKAPTPTAKSNANNTTSTAANKFVEVDVTSGNTQPQSKTDDTTSTTTTTSPTVTTANNDNTAAAATAPPPPPTTTTTASTTQDETIATTKQFDTISPPTNNEQVTATLETTETAQPSSPTTEPAATTNTNDDAPETTTTTDDTNNPTITTTITAESDIVINPPTNNNNKRLDELNEVVYPDAASCLKAKGLGKYVEALTAQGIISYHDLGKLVEDPSDPFWSKMPPFPDKKKLLALVALVRGDGPPTSTTAATTTADDNEDNDDDAPSSAPVQQREKSEFPCNSYEVDLHAPTFGTCVCGHPKSRHGKESEDQKANRFLNLQRTASATKREGQNNTSSPGGSGNDGGNVVIDETPKETPCDNFRINLKATGFNICYCGHPKSAHGAKMNNKGTSARDMFKNMEKTSKNPAQVMPPSNNPAAISNTNASKTSNKNSPPKSGTNNKTASPVVVAATSPPATTTTTTTPPVVVAAAAAAAAATTTVTAVTSSTTTTLPTKLTNGWRIITRLDQILLSTMVQLEDSMAKSDIMSLDRDWRAYCRILETVTNVKDKGVFVLVDEANPDEDTHVAHDLAQEHETDIPRRAKITEALDGVLKTMPDIDGEAMETLKNAFDEWSGQHQNNLELEREALDGFAPITITTDEGMKEENERFNKRVLTKAFEHGDGNFFFTWLVSKCSEYESIVDVCGGLRSSSTMEQWNQIYPAFEKTINSDDWEKMKNDGVI